MSDSDSEILGTNRVFAFQNESTTISARGPNINSSNLTGISFRNNVLTSTMNIPRNHEWQRRGDSNYDQRSMGYRRGTSPMSIASACDARQRNFNNLSYARGMSSQRSVYNGRAGSPMSMRSIDSNATMSASDIAMAFKTNQFNKNDMRIIKEAYNKFMKQKARKRIEKRRNLKLFLKGYRRKSGYDSGELGSNSSLSSDDNRSTRTSNYKYNMSSCRSTKTDITEFRRTIKESNMFDDCTDNFRQNKVGRPANIDTSKTTVNLAMSQIKKPSSVKSMPPVNLSTAQSQSFQQDRFKNGFLLPSQRFNRSVAASSIPEGAEKLNQPEKNKNLKSQPIKKKDLVQNDPALNSDDEEIFSEITAIEKPAINQRKRSIDSDDDIYLPVHKKPKGPSPNKNMSQSFKNSTVIDKAKNDFEFAKPAFPVRKSANLKPKEKILSKSTDMNPTEKLISKSRGPLSDTIMQPVFAPIISPPNNQTDKNDDIELSSISQNKSDLSMRPSFIKRKLFTQSMDVTKKTDIAANSPLNSIYGSIQKERNKARKLVTSQYCLSRDVQADENNLLELIHKIVPAESMNATNQTSKIADNVSNKNNMSEDDDKWDVTSIISVRNNDENVSDTFTDEDILGKQPSPKPIRKTTPHKQSKNTTPAKPSKKVTPPKLIIGKKSKKSPPKATRKVLIEENGTPMKTVQKYVKTFWDTDFESDAEKTPLRKSESKENKRTETKLESPVVQNVASKEKFRGFSSMFPTNKTIINNTVDSVQKLFNNTNKSFKLCSHRNTKPNAKKVAQEKVKDDAKSCIEPQNKKQKAIKTNINKNKQETKQGTKKSPSKTPKNKETPKKRKEKEPKEQASMNDRTLRSAEKNKESSKKIDTVQRKPQKKKEITEKSTIENKPQSKKNNTVQNKKEVKNSDPTTKPQSNKTSEIVKKRNNKEKILLDISASSTKKNNKPRIAKVTLSRLSDYIYYRNTFNETNNNKSIRPVRSCRNSKLNDTGYSR